MAELISATDSGSRQVRVERRDGALFGFALANPHFRVSDHFGGKLPGRRRPYILPSDRGKGSSARTERSTCCMFYKGQTEIFTKQIHVLIVQQMI